MAIVRDLGRIVSPLDAEVITDSELVTQFFTASGALRSIQNRFTETVSIRDFGATGDGVTDDSAAIAAAITYANTRAAAGFPITLLASAGRYRIAGTTLPTFIRGGAIIGDGRWKTIFYIDPSYAGGDVFSWSEAWMATYVQPFGTSANFAAQKLGAMLRSLTLVADRSAAVQQNAIVFYDRNDTVLVEDVDVFYFNGRGLYVGAKKLTTEGYMRESRFHDLRVMACGAVGMPAVEFTSDATGDATNEIEITGVDIYGAHGPGLVIRNASASRVVRQFRINSLRIEGREGNPDGVTADLMTIGDSSLTGGIQTIMLSQVELCSPYSGYAALRITSPDAASAPQQIAFDGAFISGAGLGTALRIDSGKRLYFRISAMGGPSPNVSIGASPLTASPIVIDGGGVEAYWTWSIDATATSFVRGPVYAYGVPGSTQATVAQGADGTPAIGNVRGAGATEWQTNRFAATQVASAARSTIGGGTSHTASGVESTIAGGSTGTATGFRSTIGGGHSNLANGDYTCIPGGTGATTQAIIGKFAFASGAFSAQGDCQFGLHVLRATGTTALRLTSDGNAAANNNCANLPNSRAWLCDIDIVARDQTTGAAATWYVKGALLTRGASAGTTALAGGTLSAGPTSGTPTATTPTLSADATNGGLSITSSTSANTNHWTARILTTEVG